MPATISFTTAFLNSLLDLPPQISKKLPEVVKLLENKPNNKYALKIVGCDSVWRIYVTKKYRLFYTYGERWVKLLKLLKREKDTYKDVDELTDSQIPTYIPLDEWDDRAIEEERTSNSYLLTQERLERWLIPQEYWSDLLAVTHDHQLLNLALPEVYLERIIDNLYPKDLAQIQKETEFNLEDSQDLDKFVLGELEVSNFFLKLSDEQKRLLKHQDRAPTLIKGGAGTGKSTLALYRVKQLVDSGVKKVLFTTHNETLVNYSKELLQALVRQPFEQLGVEVCTVDDLVQKYYSTRFGQPKLASHEILLFFLESALRTVQLERRLESRLEKLGIVYLLEEVLDVIEARGTSSVSAYIEIERSGRKYALDRRMREAVWKVYEQWQALVCHSGYITIGRVRQQALEIVKEQTIKPYEAVIVDEAQDLSPVALKFLVGLSRFPSGIYLTADTSQSLYQRAFSWDHVQATIGFRGQTHVLRRSFRNTQQIGKACSEISERTRDDDIRQFSLLEGDKPKIILTDDLLAQVKAIAQFFRQASKRWKLPIYAGVVLAPNTELGYMLAHQLSFSGLRAEWIESKDITLTRRCIKVLSLHATKGLEFPFVAIVGLQDKLLPQATHHLPDDEREELLNQERRLFYVGCSRAMRSLLVCGSRSNPSPFLAGLENSHFWQVEEVK